ncbi:MAG: hypothetical protein GKS05_12375 [Nitrospirales bacterium]|nr:hypothetical protein [Nitrospirales bacterium]
MSKQPVKKGGEIPYSETRFRTIHPGIVTTTTSGHLFGRPLGTTSYLSIEQYYAPEPVWQDLPYKANESFEYLQDRAEGTCFIRWKGMIVEIESCPWLGLSQAMDFDLLEEPVTEWWVRVTDDNNQPLGWLLIEEESVKFLPRTL